MTDNYVRIVIKINLGVLLLPKDYLTIYKVLFADISKTPNK